MITKEELIEGTKWENIPKDHQNNLLDLLAKLNLIRAKWAKPEIVSSGYRSLSQHLAIYKKKGITDQKLIPMKSRHLSGQAADIGDADTKTPGNQILEFQQWCRDNESWLLNEVGVWIEDFAHTTSWVHFQSVPYGSWKPGKSIFFNP